MIAALLGALGLWLPVPFGSVVVWSHLVLHVGAFLVLGIAALVLPEGSFPRRALVPALVVAVEDRVKHALYGKVMRKTSRLKAHDETNQCGIGDRVLIMETRPLSATKRWRLVEVLEKAK